jgi:hypothetical protein
MNSYANYGAFILVKQGAKYVYLDNLSTNVAMASCPDRLTGKCVTKSMETDSQYYVGTGKGKSKPAGCRVLTLLA